MRSSFQNSPSIKNSILATLSLPDFDLVRSFLQPVSLEKGAVLNESNKRIEYVNFVETGIVSLMTLASRSMVETAMVGCHGAVGASIVLGVPTSMHKSIVSVPGKALRIRVDDLQRSMDERPQIREHVLRHVQSLMVHSSQTALCGVLHELEQRLACWLCLACNALEGERLPITHDHLSFLIGRRRAGVTEALLRFEKQGLVHKSRGVLQVCERAQLEQKACSCYGVIATAYGWTKSPISASYAMRRLSDHSTRRYGAVDAADHLTCAIVARHDGAQLGHENRKLVPEIGAEVR
jgi:CRP-like cAMP-binding protein